VKNIMPASMRLNICFSMLLVMLIVQLSGFDEWLASHIYHLYGAWHWQQSWLLETVIHQRALADYCPGVVDVTHYCR
jgi:membrane-associated PAP2 superfamily phosphatase